MQFATPKPLSRQKATQTTIDSSKGRIIGRGSVIWGYIRDAYVTLCNKDAEIAAPQPRIRPADKSVPANTIIPATPSAKIPLVEACAKIFKKLFLDKM